MKKDKKTLLGAMKYSVIGIEFGLSVVVGALIGYFLDLYLGTDPWMFIFWFFCGIIAGFRTLYRVSKRFLNESKNDEDQGSNGKKEDFST